MTTKEEADILLAGEGDEDAFRRLYDSHRERIYRIGYRYTRSVHDAEDILQDTFVKAFRRIGTFHAEGDSSFESWLASICINCAIDHMRKRRRRKTEATVALHDTIAVPQANENSPLSAAEREEAIRLIRGAAEKLAPRQRVAFDLRYNDHLNIKEIARLMNCSENAVKTHLSRSVRKLRAWLAPLWRYE
jgi:RNA polymerase sigma-70 factor (ECF subfamily)